MPVFRYFVFVGGVLLALLFVADAYAPSLPVVNAAEIANIENPTLRIRSDRKWPERIVFDTSIPTIAPVQAARADTSAPASITVADVTAQVRVRDSFAQFAASEPRKPESKAQRKRKIAHNRSAPVLLAAQQPRFGFSFQ